jgi:intergrase/recombinase
MTRGAGFEPARPLLTTGLAVTSFGESVEKKAYFVDFSVVREDFFAWLKNRGITEKHRRAIVSYLTKFGKPIREPMDVVRVFEGLSVGQRHQMIRAVRNLFNFYECQGLADKGWLDVLRKNVPREEIGVDLWIPSEEDIVRSLRVFGGADGYRSYFAVYNFILDSGLRFTEAMRFLGDFWDGKVEGQLEPCDGFYVAPLGYMRKSKFAYYAFFTEYTLKLLKSVEKITYESAKGNVRKRLGKDIIAYKYLRKFAFDVMTDEELNIPESVADFIQGRTPKSIGARHYMKLKRKAVHFYPRYAEYVTQLRQKAELIKA